MHAARIINRLVTSVVCICPLFFVTPTLAQVSLDPADTIWEVEHAPTKEKFTIVKAGRDSDLWFYIPTRPRLASRIINGVELPWFSLLRYQYKDPTNPNKLKEAGILQFAATLDAGEALDTLKKAVATRAGIPIENVKISSLPFKSASASLYTPDGQLLAGTKLGDREAPTFGTQNLIFSLPLTSAGTDVYEALTKSATGIPVIVDVVYEGLTPPSKFRIKVDYQKAFEHFSSDVKTRVSVGSFGFFGLIRTGSASYTEERAEVREKLINSGALTVEGEVGTGFQQSDLDKYLDPVLQRLAQSILILQQTPEKITPAQAPDPTSGGGWLNVGQSAAYKTVSQVTQLNETISFSLRKTIDRKTSIQGYIGLGGKYEANNPTLKLLYSFVEGGNFSSAYIMLPPMGTIDGLNISEVQVNLAAEYKNGKTQQRTATWRDPGAWSDVSLASISNLAFELSSFGVKKVGDYKLKQSGKILYPALGSMKTLELQPRAIAATATQLETGLIDVLPLVDQVQYRFDTLPWIGVDNNTDGIRNAIFTMQTDGKAFASGFVLPASLNGVKSPPRSVFLLFDQATLPKKTAIRFEATFKDNTKRVFSWEGLWKDAPLIKSLDCSDLIPAC